MTSGVQTVIKLVLKTISFRNLPLILLNIDSHFVELIYYFYEKKNQTKILFEKKTIFTPSK